MRQSGFQRTRTCARLQTLFRGLVVARARVPEQALQVSACQPFESACIRMATSRHDTSCEVTSCRDLTSRVTFSWCHDVRRLVSHRLPQVR